ncbi:MAG: Stp1/IreP family PP2C-type Ser/Thr phosphatase [Clostridiaceae bacterium]
MIGFISDMGKKRGLNEDYVDYLLSDEFQLYIVADGMGGHNAGEVASRMAVETVKGFIGDNWNKYDCETLLRYAIEEANKRIIDHAGSNITLMGMGTTIIAALAAGSTVYVANVGDSAGFLLKEGEISKITKDHSLVQELVDIGSITEEEALTHPRRNIITRAIGASENLEADIFKIPNKKENKFLLCSDGLINEVSKDEIREILMKYNNKDAAEQLVLLANEREGRDNITVLVFGGEN